MKAYNLLHLALVDELNEHLEKVSEVMSESKNNYGDDKGNLYFPINISGIENGLTADNIVDFARNLNLALDQNHSDGHYHTFNDFYENCIDPQVKTIAYDNTGETPQIELVKFLKGVHKVKDIMGVLLKSSDSRDAMIINPLHPLTALAIKLGQIELPKKGKIIIYNWSNSFLEECSPEETLSTYTEDNENLVNEKYIKWHTYFVGTSPYFINRVQVRNRVIIDIPTFMNNLSNFSSIQKMDRYSKIKVEKNVTSSEEIGALLVPLQMAIKGMTLPWYGYTFIEHPTGGDSSPKGINFGNYISGNIKHTGHGEDLNVCTGNYSNTTDSGWLTLSRINVDSMWHQHIIRSRRPEDKRELYADTKSAQLIAGSLLNIEVDDSSEGE